MKRNIFMILASLAMIACVQEQFDASDNAHVVASFVASREDFGGVKTRTTLADGCRVVYKNYNFGGYVANFTPATMGNNFAAGFYQFDYN